MEEKYIVALEIGSSKIRGALATVDSDSAVNVLAVQEEPVSESVRYGQIRNLEEVSRSIDSILKKMVNVKGINGRRIEGVYVGISGFTVNSSDESATMKFSDEREITSDVIRQLEEKAASDHISDKEIYKIVPCEYTVNKEVTSKPIGCYGNTVSASFKIIEGNPVIKNNIKRVIIDRLHIDLNDCIVSPLAIANCVLSQEEKSLGCMMVDFGAETTTVVIYKGGVLRYIFTLPMGSRNIDRDLMSLNMLADQAEDTKRSIGIIPESEKGPVVNDMPDASTFIQARAAEIVANVFAHIEFAGLKPADLPCGIVVVGGGGRLKGLSHLIADQTKMKVRMGTVGRDIRLCDSSTSSEDAIDVISLIMEAAKKPVDCLSVEEEYTVHQNAVETETYIDGSEDEPNSFNVEEDYIEALDGPRKQKKPKKQHTSSIISKINGTIRNIFKSDIDDTYEIDEEEN